MLPTRCEPAGWHLTKIEELRLEVNLIGDIGAEALCDMLDIKDKMPELS